MLLIVFLSDMMGSPRVGLVERVGRQGGTGDYPGKGNGRQKERKCWRPRGLHCCLEFKLSKLVVLVCLFPT